jgi:cell division protein FtsB
MQEALTGENKKTSRKGLGIVLTVALGCVAVAALFGGYEAAHLSESQTDEVK